MSFLSHVLEHTAVLEFGVLLHTSLHRLLSLPNVELTAVRISTLYLVYDVTSALHRDLILRVNKFVSEGVRGSGGDRNAMLHEETFYLLCDASHKRKSDIYPLAKSTVPGLDFLLRGSFGPEGFLEGPVGVATLLERIFQVLMLPYSIFWVSYYCVGSEEHRSHKTKLMIKGVMGIKEKILIGVTE